MNSVYMAYGMLALAIISEVTGSTFLVKSEGFSKIGPSIVVVITFCIAFYLLSQVIKVIPLGIAYAIWAGVGIVLTFNWLFCFPSKSGCGRADWHWLNCLWGYRY
jgi:small multidrug resistance pump